VDESPGFDEMKMAKVRYRPWYEIFSRKWGKGEWMECKRSRETLET